MTAQPTRDQLRALADKATPGSWEAHGTTIAAITGSGSCQGCSGLVSPAHEPSCYWSEIAAAGEADAEFIAAARTAIPQLLDQLDQVEAERDEWRQTALDEQGAALDLLEVIKDRDQRIERVRGLMNHNDNIDNVPIDDLLHALDGDA